MGSNGTPPGPGDDRERLVPLIYKELRRQAQTLMPGGGAVTLQPTAVVNGAFLKLLESEFEFRTVPELQVAAAKAMRDVLIDACKARGAQKRGGGVRPVPLGADPAAPVVAGLDPEVELRLDEAVRQLEREEPEASHVFLRRRYTGLTIQEMADAHGVPPSRIKTLETRARMRLRQLLKERGVHGPEDL